MCVPKVDTMLVEDWACFHALYYVGVTINWIIWGAMALAGGSAVLEVKVVVVFAYSSFSNFFHLFSEGFLLLPY